MPAIFLTLAIEMIGAFSINQYFNSLIKKYKLLASVIPVISAISGNIGLQSASITIRALALGLV